MRSLTRSYLRTFARLRLETWLAHGTLLGWWWNGRTLPWDYDVDAQVTGRTLIVLAKRYNGSLHEYIDDDDENDEGEERKGKCDEEGEDHADPQESTYGSAQKQKQQHQQRQQRRKVPRPADTANRANRANNNNNSSRTRRYLLDVNPFATSSPGRGTGANVIDARWVDVDTGMYVDVTAVMDRNWTSVPLPPPSATFPLFSSSSSSRFSSASDDDDDNDDEDEDEDAGAGEKDGAAGLLSCKNGHFYRAGDLFPLRETTFEGVPALVPWAYEPILVAEYGRLSLILTEWER